MGEVPEMSQNSAMPETVAGPEDLSLVLSQIGRGKLAKTRARMANSTEARIFLELGLSLLQDDLLLHTGPNFDQGDRSRLFESLSRERILEQAKQRHPGQGELLSDDKYRYLWERKGRYTEDLISYLFRNGPSREHLTEMQRAALDLLPSASLREIIQLVAAAEVQSMLSDPITSLQTIVQAAMPSHPKVRQYIQAQYELLLPSWANLYEQVSVAYGLRLKPGVTWFDIALLFNAVVEGTLVRARIDRVEARLSNGEGVLAGAIFLMLPALLDGLKNDYSLMYAKDSAGADGPEEPEEPEL